MPKKRIAKAVAAVVLVGVFLFLANTVGFQGAEEAGKYWCFGWPDGTQIVRRVATP